MVEERPKRRGRKKVRGRPKKTAAKRPRAKQSPSKRPPAKQSPSKRPPAKQPPVLKVEQLPGLLEGDIPEQPPVAEEAAVEEKRPAVTEESAISTEAVEKAMPVPEPEPAGETAQPSTLPVTLMDKPKFRQRVIRSVVRRLR